MKTVVEEMSVATAHLATLTNRTSNDPAVTCLALLTATTSRPMGEQEPVRHFRV